MQQLELFSHLHQLLKLHQFLLIEGINPNLLTEKSDSLNVGVIYTPTNLPFTTVEIPGNLRIALDYITVDLTDAIIDLNPDEVMSACYDAGSKFMPELIFVLRYSV